MADIVKPTNPILSAVNPADAHKKYATRAKNASDSLLTSLSGIASRGQQTQEEAVTTITSTQRAIKETRSEGDAARRQRAQIEQYPEVLANLMGVFDPSMDWDAINQRVADSNVAEDRLKQSLIQDLQKQKILGDIAEDQRGAVLDHYNTVMTVDKIMLDAVTAARQSEIRETQEKRAGLHSREQTASHKQQMQFRAAGEHRARHQHVLQTALTTQNIAHGKTQEKRAVRGAEIREDQHTQGTEAHEVNLGRSKLALQEGIKEAGRGDQRFVWEGQDQARKVKAEGQADELHALNIARGEQAYSDAVVASARASVNWSRGNREEARKEAARELQMLDPATVANMVNGKVPLPAGTTMAQARKVHEGILQLQHAETLMQKAILEKDTATAQYALNIIALKAPGDLAVAIDTAHAEGDPMVTINGTQFPIEVMEKALTQSRLNEKTAIAARQTILDASSVSMIEKSALMDNVAKYVNISGMPATAIQSSDIFMEAKRVQVEASNARAANLFVREKEIIQAGRKKINEMIDADFKKRYTPEELPLVTAYYEGTAPTMNSLLTFMGNSVANGMTQPADYAYQPLLKNIAGIVAKQVTATNGTIPEGKTDIGSLMALLNKEKIDINQFAHTVFTDNDLKFQFNEEVKGTLWRGAIQQARDFVDVSGTKWANHLNYENPDFRDPQTGSFDPAKMLMFLRVRWDMDKTTDPAIAGQAPYDQQLLTIMNMDQFIDNVHGYYVNDKQSPAAWGLGHFLHGGNPTSGVPTYLELMIQQHTKLLNARQEYHDGMAKGALPTLEGDKAAREINREATAGFGG